jgi:EAL domain-containing protein (putative c-di-GMP-specific phosphodiesterase class I)
MTTTSTAPADDRATADRPAGDDAAEVIRGGDFQTVVRPVVECGTGRVVGYDVHAAAVSGALEQPGALRAAIQDSPDSAELGTLCRRAAMTAVAAIGPGAGDRTRVFLDTPVEAIATLADEEPALRERLVLQIDSARVRTHPAATLRAVERARRDGWAVAVRGVGGSEASLAVLPLLDPNVVRLDVGVVREHELPDQRDLRGHAGALPADGQPGHGRGRHLRLGREHPADARLVPGGRAVLLRAR